MARVLLVVEDDLDIRLLVRLTFAADPAFELDGETSNADSATVLADAYHPDLIVLDHRLEGDVMGLDAAERLKSVNPNGAIILFSASEELRGAALDSPWIDAFVLKTELHKLLAVGKDILHLTQA